MLSIYVYLYFCSKAVFKSQTRKHQRRQVFFALQTFLVTVLHVIASPRLQKDLLPCGIARRNAPGQPCSAGVGQNARNQNERKYSAFEDNLDKAEGLYCKIHDY